MSNQPKLPIEIERKLPPPKVDLVAQVVESWSAIDEKSGMVCLLVRLKMADGVDRIVNMQFNAEFANRNAAMLMKGARKLKGA